MSKLTQQKIISGYFAPVCQLYFTCYISQFQNELIAFKSLSRSARKIVLYNTIRKFLDYKQNNFNFDVYDISLYKYNSKGIKILILFQTKKIIDFILYSELSQLTRVDKQILMLNVAVHIGRKIMKANNPELDIFIFDFNKAKSKNK